MDRLTIVKVGGKVVEDPQLLNTLLDHFTSITGNKILVHGGGPLATKLAEKLGVETRMVEGRRITDEETLEIATMVYAGLVNKKIVAGIQARNCNALGLTGADLDLIRARKRPVEDIDYGFVGDVEDVNTRELRLLLGENVIPVVAPLTHDGQGTLLNTNADTIASRLGIELSHYYKVLLFYCFEKKGVLSNPEDENSVLSELSKSEFAQFKNSGIISSGMIPKLTNGFDALQNGVSEVLITNPDNFFRGRGTRLRRD
ncbi:MAG TPA: acetylglutamate kinase [Prolixibacteraceae bacterium]|nr:acetylglutamate kinase [Prolixibacteraceae bacterium]